MKRILAPVLGTAFLLCITATASQAAVITCAYGTSVGIGGCDVSGGGANDGDQGLLGGTSAEFDFDPDEDGDVDYWVVLTFDSVAVGPFDVTMEDILGEPDLENFPNHVCVPIDQLISCVEFEVTDVPAEPTDETWQGGYDISIFWMADTENNGFSDDGGRIRVLHAESVDDDGNEDGDNVYDVDITVEESYSVCPPDCEPIPIDGPKIEGDPVITGSDDNFHRFTVTRVPEPATVLLLTLGGATMLYRRRRR